VRRSKIAPVRTRILNQTRGNVVCEDAAVAAGMLSRMRGLLGRAELAPGAGMLFRGEPSIHSAFMRFDFDAIFLDGDLRVVKLAERVRPWRALGATRARNVLEIAAGEIARLGVQVGDQLAVTEEKADANA